MNGLIKPNTTPDWAKNWNCKTQKWEYHTEEEIEEIYRLMEIPDRLRFVGLNGFSQVFGSWYMAPNGKQYACGQDWKD